MMTNRSSAKFFAFYSTTREAWDAMYEALTLAEFSIEWEVYIFADDRAGARFIDLLKQKARSGVRVRLVVDHIGSRFLSKTVCKELSISGVDLVFYNPTTLDVRLTRWFHRLWKRNHRKVLIIDEATAFIGGVNVTFAATDWDDLHLRLAGKERIKPLVRDFQVSYEVAKHGRPLMHTDDIDEYAAVQTRKERSSDVMFVGLSPHVGSDRRLMRRFYLRALERARYSITIFTPYYVPYQRFLAALTAACKRGVTVTIITPLRSDHRFVDYMSYYFLELSERLGARIFLLPRMNHAKGFLIDNRYGLVGSSNFTHRAFLSNAESDVFFNHPSMVHDLQRIIAGWQESAASVGESGRKQRKFRANIVHWIAQLFREYV